MDLIRKFSATFRIEVYFFPSLPGYCLVGPKKLKCVLWYKYLGFDLDLCGGYKHVYICL
jgi:hypothetical protein